LAFGYRSLQSFRLDNIAEAATVVVVRFAVKQLGSGSGDGGRTCNGGLATTAVVTSSTERITRRSLINRKSCLHPYALQSAFFAGAVNIRRVFGRQERAVRAY
jgi:hypothetical protein